MSDQLVILINGVSQLQYNRSKSLPANQRQFLDKMNTELQRGIMINGQYIENPELPQRAQFVALNLIQSIQNAEEQKASAMCAYLAVFLPDLKQVKATQNPDGILIDLVFDEDYVKEIKVNFTPSHHKPR